jgi:hypothetical protein
MNSSKLETISYVTQCIGKAVAEAPDWQVIEKYWITSMQQNNTWFIACVASIKKILEVVC